MSDFHRSLDRAMVNARCDYWAITDDPYTSPPRDTGVVDAYDPHTDWGVSGAQILAIQDKVNRDVANLAAMMAAPALYQPRDHATTLEFTASIETIELLCGVSLIPLCERQIPAEGVE